MEDKSSQLSRRQKISREKKHFLSGGQFSVWLTNVAYREKIQSVHLIVFLYAVASSPHWKLLLLEDKYSQHCSEGDEVGSHPHQRVFIRSLQTHKHRTRPSPRSCRPPGGAVATNWTLTMIQTGEGTLLRMCGASEDTEETPPPHHSSEKSHGSLTVCTVTLMLLPV